MSRPADLLPPDNRPLSPHAGPGARPSTAPQDRDRRRRTRRRTAVLAGTGALLAGVIGFAASATALLYAIYAHLLVVPFGIAALASWWVGPYRRSEVPEELPA